MAKLLSEDDEYISFLTIHPAKRVEEHTLNLETQRWQAYSIVLGSGETKLEYGGKEGDGFLFCRSPNHVDEIKVFTQRLVNFLDDGLETISFEPAEPSFELTLHRVDNMGVKVQIWVDDGNATTEIARWDAFGLRFFTTSKCLLDFINELKRDFGC